MVKRDQWGRPVLIGPDGKEKAYTRVSSLAGYIKHMKGLHIWDVRNIVRGMGIREDLAGMAASLPSITGDKKKDAITNACLDEYADAARETAGEHANANWGTAIHGFTEPGMEGNPAVPERMQPDVDSYWTRYHEYGIRTVASELFVVNESLGCAGTLDDLYWLTAFGLIVGDKKTGKNDLHSILIQLAIYANSEVYDVETGERRPLWSLIPGGNPEMLNLKWALFVHIPKGQGETVFYKANIDLGWKMANIAAAVRDYQRMKEGLVFDAHNEIVHAKRYGDAMVLLRDASSIEELKGIAQTYQDVWDDTLTGVGRQRMTALMSVSA